MDTTYAVLAGILGLAATATAIAKLTKLEEVASTLERVGVARRWWRWLAAVELVGVAGLVAGIAEPAVGLAATIGLLLYFAGAVVAHLRAGDHQIGPASGLALLALAAAVTGAISVEV